MFAVLHTFLMDINIFFEEKWENKSFFRGQKELVIQLLDFRVSLRKRAWVLIYAYVFSAKNTLDFGWKLTIQSNLNRYRWCITLIKTRDLEREWEKYASTFQAEAYAMAMCAFEIGR